MENSMGGKKLGTDHHLKVIKIAICFLLCSMIATLGPFAYLFLRDKKIRKFTDNFRSVSHLMSNSISGSIQRKIEAGNFVSNMFSGAIETDKKQVLPNFTMANFENTINALVEVANCRYITFAPLVDNTTRNGWEAYAAKNVHLLNGPPSLSTSTNGTWVVADGIYNLSSESVPIYDMGNMGKSSPYPHWMFPIWQVAPIAHYSDLIMLDSHAIKFGRIQDSVNKALTSRKAVFTGIVNLIPDVRVYGSSRPSSIIYSPIISMADGNPIVGMFSGGFSWDVMLSGIVNPRYRRIRCVVKSDDRTYTFQISDGNAYLIGEGDLTDANYKHFAVPLKVGLDNYIITIYPTSELYYHFVTNSPRNISLGVVLIIATTAFVVFIYFYLTKKWENILKELIKDCYAEAKSRKDVLLAKKVYVRFMSHEMRTPLNVMHLGLSILGEDLVKSRKHDRKKQAATVKEIMGACDIAVTFLNELLNFGKLEDGLLTIETVETNVLCFIASTVKLLMSHAQDKGVTINFDLGPNSDLSLSDVPFGDRSSQYDANQRNSISDSPLDIQPLSLYLNERDFVNIDSQKMGNVFQSMLSNAIKYSPSGGVVHLKARKIVRSNSTFVFTDLKAGDHEGSDAARNVHLESSSCSSDESVSGISTEAMVLSVTDSGPGMALEDCSRMFQSTNGFDPSNLQPSKGNGLGSMIVRSIVDLHRGTISMSSDGVGHGCSSTLEIPIIRRPTSRVSWNEIPVICSSGSERQKRVVEILSETRIENQEAEENEEEKGDEGKAEKEGVANCLPELYSLGSTAFHAPQSNLSPVMATKVEVEEPSACHPSSNVALPSSCTSDDSSSCNLPLAMKIKKQLYLLVVDDSALNRRMIIKLLGDHICDQAVDGVEAVAKYMERVNLFSSSQAANDSDNVCTEEWSEGTSSICSRIYDAILMDYMMPNMDGPTATKIIREIGYPGPIIGITGNALPADIDHFIASGATQVLLKPVSFQALGEALSLVSQ